MAILKMIQFIKKVSILEREIRHEDCAIPPQLRSKTMALYQTSFVFVLGSTVYTSFLMIKRKPTSFKQPQVLYSSFAFLLGISSFFLSTYYGMQAYDSIPPDRLDAHRQAIQDELNTLRAQSKGEIKAEKGVEGGKQNS